MTGGTRPDRLPKQMRRSRGERVADRVMGVLIDAGVVPHSYVMTTRGRRTGRLHRTPVTLVEHEDGRRWLVAPYGPMSWVHNARAAGMVTLRRGAKVEAFGLREVGPDEAGPVLKDYLAFASATRPYFYAHKNSPVSEFVAEAHLHPVFELQLAGSRADQRGADPVKSGTVSPS
jgi:deazaflavin-dependent oxidoreductase (nitroreductase family)